MQKCLRILTESLKYIVLINLVLAAKGLICGEAFPFSLSLSLVCPILCGFLAVLAERNRTRAEENRKTQTLCDSCVTKAVL